MSPTSEDVVIRAAYRALMLRYHPDADPSGEAAQRARAINAAYAVLCDPEKRARYDGSLAAQGLIKPDPAHRSSLARRMMPGPAGLIGLAALAAVAALIILSPPIGVLPEDRLPLSAEPAPVRPATDRMGVAPPSEEAMDLEPAPNEADVPVRSINPDRPVEARPASTSSAGVRPVEAPPAETGTAANLRKAAPKAIPASAAKETPGNCVLGDGWADRAICSNSNLTALDRQHGLLYAQSWAKADEPRRAALLGSRERFQQQRNACRSENCLTSTYIARLREISDIMARGAQQ